MKNILVIGGGAMGAAFTIPSLENKNNVTITEPYSKRFIKDLSSKKKFHSALKIKLPKQLKFRKFSKNLLKENFDLIVIALSLAGIDFIGKEALMKIKDKELDKRLMMFTLKENKPGEPLLLHDEPIYLDNKIIGQTTSGNYSFCYEKNLSFGYVNSGNSYETLKDKNIFIEVEKKKYPVDILQDPLNQKNYKN